MNSSAQPEMADIRVRAVSLTEDDLWVELMDGPRISVPLAWYPRLAGATAAQRSRWKIAGGEDSSTEALLRGARAPRFASRGSRPGLNDSGTRRLLARRSQAPHG